MRMPAPQRPSGLRLKRCVAAPSRGGRGSRRRPPRPALASARQSLRGCHASRGRGLGKCQSARRPSKRRVPPRLPAHPKANMGPLPRWVATARPGLWARRMQERVPGAVAPAAWARPGPARTVFLGEQACPTARHRPTARRIARKHQDDVEPYGRFWAALPGRPALRGLSSLVSCHPESLGAGTGRPMRGAWPAKRGMGLACGPCAGTSPAQRRGVSPLTLVPLRWAHQRFAANTWREVPALTPAWGCHLAKRGWSN